MNFYQIKPALRGRSKVNYRIVKKYFRDSDGDQREAYVVQRKFWIGWIGIKIYIGFFAEEDSERYIKNHLEELPEDEILPPRQPSGTGLSAKEGGG